MKPSLPKGVRDFLPEQVSKRNYIFETIKKVFIKFGYAPIETPVMESLATLTGKYGEEGDKLLFKVLNNGDFLAEVPNNILLEKNSNKIIPEISKRGLRYDLTVPFARFVVQHQNELSFPFKRYQIQPVWRADRPQKGRYQEFFQCDVDVVGSNSLMYEAELVQIYDEVFQNLDLPVQIKINNRKILSGMAEVANIPDKMMEMTVAIDKLDKIGKEGVRNDLLLRGISEESIEIIDKILETKTLADLKICFENSEIGKLGIAEMEEVYRFLGVKKLHNELKFDVTLARGLSYYTGCIFEVAAKNVAMGSIGGGGRYDNLTGMFGLPNLSGVGVSFGAERIYDVLEELNKFPTESKDALQILLIALDEDSHFYAFEALSTLRKGGISADLYPSPSKLQKQMKYANDRNVPFVIIVGSEEMKSGNFVFKNMKSGEQMELSLENIVKRFIL